jgi:hypothetical protein
MAQWLDEQRHAAMWRFAGLKQVAGRNNNRLVMATGLSSN